MISKQGSSQPQGTGGLAAALILAYIISRFAPIVNSKEGLVTEASKNGKKAGRPTENPKSHKISARLDAQTKAILDLYCEKNSVSVSKAVSAAIKALDKNE